MSTCPHHSCLSASSCPALHPGGWQPTVGCLPALPTRNESHHLVPNTFFFHQKRVKDMNGGLESNNKLKLT
jgi:hypothetical protein